MRTKGTQIIHHHIESFFHVSIHSFKRAFTGDFPGGPVAETQCSQCKQPEFNPWSGVYFSHTTTKDPTC